MDIQFFDGSIEQFIRSMEPTTIAKILRVVDLLEVFGQKLGMPHSKSIGSSLFELRVRGVQEIRLIYVFRNQQVIVLHAFLKKSDRIPQRELKTAINKLRTLDRI